MPGIGRFESLSHGIFELFCWPEELCRDVARAHAVTKEDYRNISRSRAAHGTQHQLDNVVLLEHSDNVSDSDQSVVPYSTPNFPVYL